MMVKRVLLTGATGFVGTQILRALKELGAYVRITSRRQDIESVADDIVFSPDIFSEPLEWWVKQLDTIDIVIHAAWFVEPREYLNSDQNWICLDGSKRLLEAFLNSKADHFVGLGTCFEYNMSLGHLSVETPLKPESEYAKAKVELFETISQKISRSAKTFAWCRLFYLYGENEKAQRLVPYLHDRLQKNEVVNLTSGEQIRDYLDVVDAGKMIAKTGFYRNEGPVNICSGVPITIRELAESIANQYDRNHLLNFGAYEGNPNDPPVIIGIK